MEKRGKKVLKVGYKVLESRIYKCSNCENMSAKMKGETAKPCEVCESLGKKNKWYTTQQRIVIVSKNINKEFEKQKNWIDRTADVITEFCGNMWFVYVHVIWFGWWLWYNLVSENSFDPFPFGLLTLIVSLEAIFLATFILISQNLQSERSELRAEMDYHVNLETEKDVKELLHILRSSQRD